MIAQEEIVINNYLLEDTHQDLIRGIETAITMIASRRDSLLIASKEWNPLTNHPVPTISPATYAESWSKLISATEAAQKQILMLSAKRKLMVSSLWNSSSISERIKRKSMKCGNPLDQQKAKMRFNKCIYPHWWWLVNLGDGRAANTTRMGDSDSLSFNDGEEVQEWRPLPPKSIKWNSYLPSLPPLSSAPQCLLLHLLQRQRSIITTTIVTTIDIMS